MLSEKNIDLIQKSKPLIEEYGLQITTRMYRRLKRDSRVRKYFKARNTVTVHLPKALAQVILAFIEATTDLEELDAQLKRISAVHVIHDIPSEAYLAVGETLLDCIREILDCDAEVLEAWSAAYIELSNKLVEYDTKLRIAKTSS